MRLNVQDDFMDNSGVYAIRWITSLPETTKPPAGMANGLRLCSCVLFVSVYLVRNPLDDSVVGETVISVIEHGDDQVFVNTDTHDL